MSIKVFRLPLITSRQMREVDRVMVEEYGIQLIQMMENAGRSLAETARHLLDDSVIGKKIFVAAGKGNNGGGGLVAARHLSNWGAEVIVLTENSRFSGTPGQQWEILQKLPVKFVMGESALNYISRTKAHLIIDSLIGYGLKGDPRDYLTTLIRKINRSGIPVLSLDIPSGLDATNGEIPSVCIQATATMTLALPKIGLMKTGFRPVVGKLFLADIGVPPALYRKLGWEIGSVFHSESVIELPHLSADESSFVRLPLKNHPPINRIPESSTGFSCLVLES